MTFSEALDRMKRGRVVARRSWKDFALNQGIAVHHRGGDKVLRFAQGDKWDYLPTWAPLQSDLFADDWDVVEASPPAEAEATRQ